MALPMEQLHTRFTHAQITTVHAVLVNGNSTGLLFDDILKKSRLETSIVTSLLNRFFERQWIYDKSMRYRLNDLGNRSVKEILNKKEEIFDLPILNS